MPSFGNRRRVSQQKKKTRPFGTLTIDTKCASQGRTFPYESRIPELNFVSYAESKQRNAAHSRDPSLKDALENSLPMRPGPKQAVPEPVTHDHLIVRSEQRQSAVRSLRGIISADDEPSLPPLHKRINGLRPSPLDLNQDISPSDQAITIGIAVSPSTASAHTKSPSSSRTPPASHLVSGNDVRQRYGQDAATPIIVITPAKDQFPPGLLHASTYRPASSVYSRYTNCMSKGLGRSKAPPIPPLPWFAEVKSRWSPSTTVARESSTTTFEEDPTSTQIVDLGDTRMIVRQSKGSTGGLPTPRRSKGWWNVLSPFSAKSAGTFFWKSPVAVNFSDQVPILDAASSMGVSECHTKAIFVGRDRDWGELRSAPVVDGDRGLSDDFPVPKRSNTASGALETHSAGINIYQIPSTGDAAAYFDSNRHFPSLYGAPRSFNSSARYDLAGWSPSQSVYLPRHSSISAEQKSGDMYGSEVLSIRGSSHEAVRELCVAEIGNDNEHATTLAHSPQSLSRGIADDATIFSSPTEDELKSAGLPRPQPTRGFTQATSDSIWSPLSATPVVEDAHIARMIGPCSSFGEQKQVELAPTPSQYGLGYATLGAATIAHSEDGSRSLACPPQQQYLRPVHIRQDSRGLGISDGEDDVFPLPQPFSEKPRLGTDRFGQLTIRSAEDDAPARPWYRRFFWLMAATCAGFLVLLIVLLAILIPQRHNDMPVQASWLNLTGFPALAVGVSTVIQPGISSAVDSCTSEPMWSCNIPGQQNGSLPNFRLEIRFRNGTLPANETDTALSNVTTTKRWQDSSLLHRSIRRNLWSDYTYSTSPSPPSRTDQEYLGQTTDNITAPYAGEESPFYISLLDPAALPTSKSRKRDATFTYPYPASSSSSNASTKARKDIPAPAIDTSGTPLVPQLYPIVSAQPLRLYNRGQETEHYGFYTYFDRSIYISNSTNANTTIANVALTNATAVCTFSQTRFHVQIWTRKGTVGALSDTNAATVAAGNSSANKMDEPGSFVYPVSITLDRHGGEAGEKGVYCYGMDRMEEGRKIDDGVKWWVDEDRAVEGTLANAADVPGGIAAKRDESAGIDGGSGGCSCQWKDWVS